MPNVIAEEASSTIFLGDSLFAAWWYVLPKLAGPIACGSIAANQKASDLRVTSGEAASDLFGILPDHLGKMANAVDEAGLTVIVSASFFIPVIDSIACSATCSPSQIFTELAVGTVGFPAFISPLLGRRRQLI